MKKITAIKSALVRELSFIFSVPAVLWQILFFYLPLFILIYASFHQSYLIFFDMIFVRIIVRSLLLAGGSALLCLLLAYPVAYFLALKVGRGKNILLFLLTLPFWTNFLIQIFAWFFLLDRNGVINFLLKKIGLISEPLYLLNNQFSIFLVMVYCYLPFMIMPLYSILHKMDVTLLEASMDLGATRWQTFKRITLPLSISGIKTGVLLVFVPAFGEFVIPALVGGSKYMLVGSLITYYFLVARNSRIGSAFTIVSGLILFGCVLLFNRCCQLVAGNRKN
ncbi:MAG: ABC transporter permease [Candidatus Babeliales bacterium]|jgi:spermidine/putrescine transport system permease protein